MKSGGAGCAVTVQRGAPRGAEMGRRDDGAERERAIGAVARVGRDGEGRARRTRRNRDAGQRRGQLDVRAGQRHDRAAGRRRSVECDRAGRGVAAAAGNRRRAERQRDNPGRLKRHRSRRPHGVQSQRRQHTAALQPTANLRSSKDRNRRTGVRRSGMVRPRSFGRPRPTLAGESFENGRNMPGLGCPESTSPRLRGARRAARTRYALPPWHESPVTAHLNKTGAGDGTRNRFRAVWRL